MELSTTQLIALAVIVVFALLALGMAHWIGHRAGNAKGYELGRTTATNYLRPLLDQRRDERDEALRLLDCRTRELMALRANVRIEGDEHTATVRDLHRRLASAGGISEEDRATLLAVADKLLLAANTWAGLRANDHAQAARIFSAYVAELAERCPSALQDHPDTELIEWLEAFAEFDIDRDMAFVRFEAWPSDLANTETLRAMIGQAKAYQEEVDTNYNDSLVSANRMCAEKSWLVHGPQACGKTSNAQAIAKALGLIDIRDDWQPGMPVAITGGLYLTNSEGPFEPFTRRILPFETAMQIVEGRLTANQALEAAA